MIPFELTVLGSNAALPAFGRFPSAQVLQVSNRLYMIDCGEGAQVRLQKVDLRISRLRHIFISHLHGDHFFGLIGLITSFSLNRRQEPLQVFGPPGLEEILRVQLRHSRTQLTFPLKIIALQGEDRRLIHEDNELEVFSFGLRHRIPTWGFLFREKERLLNLRSEQIQRYDLPVKDLPGIKQGADFVSPEGKVIPNHELTLPPLRPRSFAYCSDTRYEESLLPHVSKVDLLYHEATFLHELVAQAEITLHTTAREAAQLAARGRVGHLLIGHFSSRYRDLQPLLEEARAIFPHTDLAEEGKTFEVGIERVE